MPHGLVFSVALAAVGCCLPGALIAQEANASHTHIGHVLKAFASTPDGQGLLPTAEAEAAIALRHVRLAGRDPTNIDAMKQHARHVLNAIDPVEFAGGPGLGFGVKAAAEGIVRHIELATGSDATSENVRTHAAHVVAAGRSVTRRVAQIVELAGQILPMSDYNRAFNLVLQLRDLCEELTTGADVSGDGVISLGEGGLEQVRQHTALMAEGEGLI
jgi:hypothetical protein